MNEPNEAVKETRRSLVYAVVKAGGKQHKVAVGDVVEVNRLEGEAGDAVSLPALLLVDGHTVVSETAALAKIAVTGEIVGHHKGPKIKILKYKNKTGYRRRIGHRQMLTELLVTEIDDGKPKEKKKAATDTAKADADKPSKAAKAATTTPANTDADDKSSAKSSEAATAPAKSTKATAKAAPREAATKTSPDKAASTSAPAKAAAKADPEDKSAKATKSKSEKVAKVAKVAKATKTAKTSKAPDTDDKKD